MPKSHDIDPENKIAILVGELKSELVRIIRRIHRRPDRQPTPSEVERIKEIKDIIQKVKNRNRV